MFSGTAFNKYKNELLNEKRDTFLKLFFLLLSTMNRKKEITQHISSVSLHGIDCPHHNSQKLSPYASVFVLSDLERGGEKGKGSDGDCNRIL